MLPNIIKIGQHLTE